MPDVDITALIREVLSEELAKMKMLPTKSQRISGSEKKERWVEITNDSDLATFVCDVLAMADNPTERQAFENGSTVYRMKGDSDRTGDKPDNRSPIAMGSGVEMKVESGFFSERQADRVPGDIKRLLVGKAVRMTPLARDRLRQRGITIERIDP